MRRGIIQGVAREAEGVTLMFSNSDVRPFVQDLSNFPCNDEAVLSLERADVWTTACAVLLSLSESKGVTRN